MKKQIIASLLLVVILAPMFLGIFRLKRLPRNRRDETDDDKT